MSKAVGMYSFIIFCIGVVLSVVGGLVIPLNAIVSMILAIFGIIIGIAHIRDKEISTFLLATIALLAMVAAFAPITAFSIGETITSILVNFAVLMSPVAIIIAGKVLLKMGLEK